MSGSAYCLDCGTRAVPERGPGTPLVIRHSKDCPTWAPLAERARSEVITACGDLVAAMAEVERLRAVIAVLEAQGWAALVSKGATS